MGMIHCCAGESVRKNKSKAKFDQENNSEDDLQRDRNYLSVPGRYSDENQSVKDSEDFQFVSSDESHENAEELDNEELEKRNKAMIKRKETLEQLASEMQNNRKKSNNMQAPHIIVE